jgi:nicotinate phosphoribosyltransferase
MNLHPALPISALAKDKADLYFINAQTILYSDQRNPVITMEIFPNRSGILCGMREVLGLLSNLMPDSGEIFAMPEGEKISAKEIVLRITAPYQSFGLYETAILGILAHESGWATAARECVDAAGDIPIISFGARHVHPEVSARMEYAAIIGGCIGCATPAGAELAGITPTGTIPHAFILMYGDTVEAMRAFDRVMPPDMKRIALVDTFRDEAEESLRVAEALGEKLWGVRLDTPSERGRVTPDLVKEVRARLDQAGYAHVRIVVSGGVDAERIRRFKEEGAPVDAYGIGSAISSAPPIDFTADIKEVDGRPMAKRGRIPGKTENPRLRKIDIKTFHWEGWRPEEL